MTNSSPAPAERLRVVLFCHHDDPVNRELLPRWLGSFCDLVGLVVIREPGSVLGQRLRRERRRVGALRLLDVLAFRVYYRLRFARADSAWERRKVERLKSALPPLGAGAPVLEVANPNAPDVVRFLRELSPDFAVARCKWLLRREVYSVPRQGTFVLHPGICPEYRNAHGVFWALANADPERVGLTLLKIDDGIDTGPVYAYFHCRFDPRAESHIRIQHRLVLENLDAIRERLLEVLEGRLSPMAVTGRASGNWGQPWLTAYLRWSQRPAGRRA